MPTTQELDELIEHSKCEWISLNGVSGIKVVSKINGNSIFFPFGDFRRGTEVHPGAHFSGWLGSKSLDVIDAARVISLGWNAFYWGNGHRYIGNNVRPVWKE